MTSTTFSTLFDSTCNLSHEQDREFLSLHAKIVKEEITYTTLSHVLIPICVTVSYILSNLLGPKVLPTFYNDLAFFVIFLIATGLIAALDARIIQFKLDSFTRSNLGSVEVIEQLHRGNTDMLTQAKKDKILEFANTSLATNLNSAILDNSMQLFWIQAKSLILPVGLSLVYVALNCVAFFKGDPTVSIGTLATAAGMLVLTSFIYHQAKRKFEDLQKHVDELKPIHQKKKDNLISFIEGLPTVEEDKVKLPMTD